MKKLELESFITAVERMREAQKSFHKSDKQSPMWYQKLDESRSLEREIDQMVQQHRDEKIQPSLDLVSHRNVGNYTQTDDHTNVIKWHPFPQEKPVIDTPFKICLIWIDNRQSPFNSGIPATCRWSRDRQEFMIEELSLNDKWLLEKPYEIIAFSQDINIYKK